MTDDGPKEWVTIKVPKESRNMARGRDETYGEILEAGAKSLEGTYEQNPDVEEIQEQLNAIQRTVEQNNGVLGDTVESALDIGEHGFTDIEEQLETLETELRKTEEFAEQAKNNTETIKEGMGR